MRTPPPPRAFVAILALAALAGSTAAQSLRIYVIEVEQGASTLLVPPVGHSLLADSGRHGYGGRVMAARMGAGVARLTAGH